MDKLIHNQKTSAGIKLLQSFYTWLRDIELYFTEPFTDEEVEIVFEEFVRFNSDLTLF